MMRGINALLRRGTLGDPPGSRVVPTWKTFTADFGDGIYYVDFKDSLKVFRDLAFQRSAKQSPHVRPLAPSYVVVADPVGISADPSGT